MRAAPKPSPRIGRAPRRRAMRAFTLIELMVSIGILMILGVIIIGFLRGALQMTRTGTARGVQFETAQTVLRLAEEDFRQILGAPAHADGGMEDPAFVLMEDPFGRQMIAFTRAWGEEQSTLAGYDAARGTPGQGYGGDFTGRNVNDPIRASHGNIEVVYLMEPSRAGTRLYRAERSPPDINNGLITRVGLWCLKHKGAVDDIVPKGDIEDPEGEFAINGIPLWSHFELVAEDVLAFSIECWDDWNGRTTTWFAGRDGPVTHWSINERRALDTYAYLLPRAMKLTLIVAAREPLRAEATMVGAHVHSESSIYASDTERFPDVTSSSAYLRVNGELIAYGAKFGDTFGSCVRGALGTTPQDHADGSVILGGEAFQRVIQLPVTR